MSQRGHYSLRLLTDRHLPFTHFNDATIHLPHRVKFKASAQLIICRDRADRHGTAATCLIRCVGIDAIPEIHDAAVPIRPIEVYDNGKVSRIHTIGDTITAVVSGGTKGER